jgi:HSP20 family protein
MAFPSIFRGHLAGAYPESVEPNVSLDRVFEGLWRGLGASGASLAPTGFAPRIDILEREGEYLVTAELPGLEEKDVHIEVNGNVLTISGEKAAEHADERSGVRWSERSYGSFRRSLQLPVDVAAEKASAAFKSGVLTVTLPKAEHARVRSIPVTSS